MRPFAILGSTTARTLLGDGIRVLEDRGKTFESGFCAQPLSTVDPSSLMRAPGEVVSAEAYTLSCATCGSSSS